MAKLKTKKTAAKRFKVTKKGKTLRTRRRKDKSVRVSKPNRSKVRKIIRK